MVEVNGHRTIFKKKSFDQLNKGKRYIFFLQWMPRDNIYILSGGEVSGVFSLASDSKSELHAKFSGMNLETFLSEVIVNK